MKTAGIVAVLVLALVVKSDLTPLPFQGIADALRNIAAVPLIGDALGLKDSCAGDRNYPSQEPTCPATSLPKDGTIFPRETGTVPFVLPDPIPVTDLLNDLIVQAVNASVNSGGVKPSDACRDQMQHYLCTYVHGSLSWASDCAGTGDEPINKYMPCKTDCEELLNACTTGLTDNVNDALSDIVFGIDVPDAVAQYLDGLLSFKIFGDDGGLIFPSEAVCQQLDDTECIGNPEFEERRLAKQADDENNLMMWLLIAGGILLAIVLGLAVGVAARNKNQNEILDVYKSLEEPWENMTQKSGMTRNGPGSGPSMGGFTQKSNGTRGASSRGSGAGKKRKGPGGASRGSRGSRRSGGGKRGSGASRGSKASRGGSGRSRASNGSRR